MKLSGRKIILLLSPLLTLILFPNTSYASEIHSIVTSEVTSTGSSGGSTTGKTDIVIECNGIKKEYHSNKAENVSLNCDDSITGTVKSEVKISTSTASPTAHPTITKNIDEMKEEAKEKEEGLKKEKTTILSEIKKIFDNLFKSFHF